MYILVCRKMPNIEGIVDDRPLAIFPDMEKAMVFMRILAVNGIYASARSVEN